jgi:NAD(P)-dependent dehydrogenase (short-subunit alcohol dehydrogenase family)
MSVFRDKVAFVTGGGSGLGRALCEELADRGATTIVTDVNRAAAAEVADAITSRGSKSFAIELDVSSAAGMKESIDRVVGMYGRLDYVFNNAGIIILSEVRDMAPEHWRRIIDINLHGVLNGTVAAYGHMVRQGHGHIVNIASVGGLMHMATYSAYSATKHAVVGLSVSMRAEAARLGVRVSVVCPGTMDTGLGAAATIVRADRQRLESAAKSRNTLMDVRSAARATLRGVERNQAIIVFPFSARLAWWLYRIHPGLLAPLDSHFVNKLRAARTEDPALH